jgi:16S rRNA C967 or C1407 C5-methylase (RsmB/RsmF family)
MYNFSLPARWDSVESALSLLSPEHTIRLESLISEEEKWLKSMIKSQYSEKDWEAYSNLEDSRLEMLCKVMDLKVEVEQLKKITKEN